ncbi:MAG TPA: serine hydrolase domain-containing protein [Roseiflexaceae bacterium]|nr:serine hydrolase domain-containing protein [Roseiflexaceae bacterium]
MIDMPLDQLFSDYADAVPGASAVLIRGDVIDYAAAFGLADLEQQTPAAVTTNYRLASVSKQFTAMAILLLAADRRLNLDDPLARFFAGAPPLWRQITLRHLLTHTSGLLDYEDLIPPGTSAQLRDQDVLELVRPHAGGYHAPGALFRYSNTGYCLLALIVARVAGQPFAAFLRERIFAPLDMHDTLAYEDGGPTIPRRAYGYSLRDGLWARTDQSLTSATLGDGGIYSSVEDLARWDAALAEGRLPGPRLANVFAPHAATPDGAAYGLGWYLRGRQVAYHTGESIGFRTAIVRRLDRRITAIVLANRSEATPLALAEALIAHACGS